MATRKFGFQRWMIPVGILLAFPLAAVILTSSAERRFQSELEISRRAGAIIEPADLRRNTPPRDQNGADAYREAFALIAKADTNAVELIRRYEDDMSEERRKQVLGKFTTGPVTPNDLKKALDHWRPILTAAEKGTRKPKLDFEPKWEEGALLTFPELGNLRSIARAWVYLAKLEAAEGKVAEAFAHIESTRRLSRQLMDSPMMAGLIYGSAHWSLCDQAIISIVVANPNNPEVLTAADRALADAPFLPDFRPGLKAEAFNLISMQDIFAEDPAKLGITENDMSPLNRLLRIHWIKRGSQTDGLKIYRETIAMMPEDPSNWKKVEQAADFIDRNLTETLWFRWNNSWGAPGSYFRHGARSAIQMRRLARVTVKLLRNKKLPGSLPDYGDDSVDLFTGKAMRLISTPNGFQLYCLGPNLVDDGGKGDDLGMTVTNGKLKFQFLPNRAY